jgi:hypothetical protein
VDFLWRLVANKLETCWTSRQFVAYIPDRTTFSAARDARELAILQEESNNWSKGEAYRPLGTHQTATHAFPGCGDGTERATGGSLVNFDLAKHAESPGRSCHHSRGKSEEARDFELNGICVISASDLMGDS